MGYLLFIPPYCFTFWLLFLGISAGIVQAGKRLLKITNEDITNPKGSLMPMSFAAWGINIAVIYISTLIIILVFRTIPFFKWMISDANIPANIDNTAPSIVGYICHVLIYSGLFSFSFFVLKKSIKDRAKRNKLFCMLLTSSTIVWAALLLLMVYVYLLA